MQLRKGKSARAQASEMEHAIRKHCKVNWEQMVLALETLRDEIQSGERQGQDILAGIYYCA